MSYYRYAGSSGQTHRFSVDSKLVSAMWMYPRAHSGQESELGVKSIFVGDGASIKITCYTESGKKVLKEEGVILRNRYRGKILIPDKVKEGEMIYFEAELPRHKLKIESNVIPVRAPILVREIGWDRREVRRGDEVMIRCEFESGVEEGESVMVCIYEHNPNSVDIKVIGIPTVIKDNKIEMKWRFDYQGSTEEICTEEELKPYGKSYHNPDFYFMVIVDGIKVGENKESGLMRFRDSIDICVKDFEGRIIADMDCRVVFADGSRGEYRTDENGRLLIADISPGQLKVVVG